MLIEQDDMLQDEDPQAELAASIVREAVHDAVNFIDSEIADERIKAQRYYDGECDVGYETGRSKVVSTKVRDTIRQVKPSLQRIFFSTNRPVEFSPTGAADVNMALQATVACNAEFRRNNGFRVFCDVSHDALVKKLGVAKVYWDDTTEQTPYYLANQGYDQLLMLSQDPTVEITSIQQTAAGLFDVDLYRVVSSGKLVLESIPPEDFIIDRYATCVEDAYIIGHRAEMRASDVIAMGIDYDTVMSLSPIGSEGLQEAEDSVRRGYESDDDNEHIQDPSMRLVGITEAYLRMDLEQDGYAVLYKVLLGGDDYKLLSYEEWNRPPFALFAVDPEPHTVFGHALADLIINDQDASTMMVRGLLDNVALVNSPREAVQDQYVNMQDFLNNEIGGFVRTTRAGAIEQLTTPPVMNQTLPVVQYFDREIENKTGVTRMSGGLHADGINKAMTAEEARALVSMQSGQTEVMARNLAETGLSQVFRLMLCALVENAPPEYFARLSESNYQPIDPRSWNTEMDVIINVGIGTGNQDQKLGALNQTLNQQTALWQQGGGPNNGLVSLTQMRNTLADILSAQGVYNDERYYLPMDPQREQQLMQQAQAAASQPQQPDPATMAVLESESMRNQSRERVELMKLAQKAREAGQANDLERDKMLQDLFVEAAKILGQYGASVNTARIQRQQVTNDQPPAYH